MLLDLNCQRISGSLVMYGKVLPHLLRELQHPPMLVFVIPLIFRAVSAQSTEEFMAFTVPKLKLVLSNAKGEGLLIILKHMEQLSKLINR